MQGSFAKSFHTSWLEIMMKCTPQNKIHAANANCKPKDKFRFDDSDRAWPVGCIIKGKNIIKREYL